MAGIQIDGVNNKIDFDDDALNVFLGQIGHPKYKGPRSTAFRTRGLVEDPMKALF